MKIKNFKILLLVIITALESFAQLSLYTSASYGYFQNPLYNYEELSDQLKQTYSEFTYRKLYESSSIKFKYVSGLVLFNRFDLRNYYEHNLASEYNVLLGDIRNTEFSEEENISKAVGSNLNIELKVGGRHDKEAFKDFNNFGTGLITILSSKFSDDIFYRITNNFGYRDYSNISVLSNITDVLGFQMTNNPMSKFNFGMELSGGFKYYTESIYDTSRFEIDRSFTIKYSGKGKTGAKITVPSDKGILISPLANGTVQYKADIFTKFNWNRNSFQVNLLYRYNPNTTVRYLAQYTNTTFLTEDIYNDNFSYDGFEIQSRLIQRIFYDIEIRFDAAFQSKYFGAPALDLIGSRISDHRTDLRTTFETYISKYFNLSDNIGMGLALSSGFVRNQSNDAYNDFSSYYISFSLGFGFYTEL